MSKRLANRSVVGLCTAVLFAVCHLMMTNAARADQIGCYISVGDNDWLWDSPPVNSAASVEALFAALSKVFAVERIYWRGYQSELISRHYLSRPENFQGHAFWEWERHLAESAKTSAAAVRAAHDRGMEFWGMTALFDHGAHARSDSAKLGTPAPIEDRLRVEHPEVVPHDRYGIRRQSGPLEFAYPLVRDTLVKRHVELMDSAGYDGLMFYTYVEHFALQFEDEFGYNEPIVEEFRKRYGQDIRTETFDKHAWYRLRGEYVTQFLRELHDAFQQRGKKLGVAIDPQNPGFPTPWLCVRDVRPAGLIHMDWERWVREGIVDEIMVYCNGDQEAALNAVVAAAEGTRCKVSAIHSLHWSPRHEHFATSSVRRVIVGSYDYLEWGYPEEQDADALDSDDFLKRLRILRQAEEKKTALPAERIVAATRDPNILVRRQAMRTLATLELTQAPAAIEAALDDSETGVRCLAVSRLTKLNGPGTVARIFSAMRQRTSFQFENAAASCLANLPLERTADILKGCSDESVAVRRVTVYALGRGVSRPEAAPILLQALDDSDPYVRFCAANSVSRFVYLHNVGERLLQLLPKEQHPSVRNRMAMTLATCFRSESRWVSARQLSALPVLADAFRQFGTAHQLPDADWSFRPVGNSLLALGPRGREVLQALMDQRDDRRLADFAWRILFVPQTGWSYVTCTEKEAEAAYRQHPVLSGWKPVPAAESPPEPERMVYLQQSFDGIHPYTKDNTGSYLGESGQWRGLGDVPPRPIVQPQFKRGAAGNALRLQRGAAGAKHAVEGLRADYRLTTEHAQVEFWVYRATPDTAFAATWKDSGTGHLYIGLAVAPSGIISVLDGDRKWARTDARMPHGSWQRIQFDVDGKSLTYAARVGSDSLTTLREALPLVENTRYNMLTVSPQPPEGGIVYLDDVLVTVPNPAKR